MNVKRASAGAQRSPAKRRPGARAGRLRLAALMVPAAMAGVIAAIWLAMATLVAHQLRFPPGYQPPRADHAFAPLAQWIPDRQQLTNPRVACGADFEQLELRRTDGLMLRAWFVAGSRPAAIILLHGAGADRRLMLPYLKFIHRAGYPALMVDSVGAGQSQDSGHGMGYGWREQGDVAAAMAALKARGFSRIGALGVSQGAGAAIFAQARDHALAAIVADSAFANLAGLLRRTPPLSQLNPFFIDTVLWETGLMLGRAPARIAPARAAARLGGCALLVIQGSRDRLVSAGDAQAIYAAATGPKELWIAEGAGHAGSIYIAPDQYARRVEQFFERYLAAAQR